MKLSAHGAEALKRFEALRLKAYQCEAGRWTIGWGSIDGVTEGMVIDQLEAESRFARSVPTYELAVCKALQLQPTQGQFDAMVSLAFNCGTEAFAGSKLVKHWNLGEFEDAAMQLGEWVIVKGKVSRGQVRRRVRELVTLWYRRK
jgi:GH24 family phage-related lysozyme (muramidase)